MARAATVDVASLGAGALGSRLTTPDFTLTFAGFDGAPAPLFEGMIDGLSSLGVASINGTGGADENATVRGTEQLQLRFKGAATLQSLTLSSFDINDGPVKLTGFPIDPLATSSVEGVAFAYDAVTESLTIQPPIVYHSQVAITFQAASLLRVLTLTGPTASDTGRGIGMTSLTYDVLPDTAPRPNILIINCDDLGAGCVGVLWQNSIPGSRKFATPQLDKLASEGMILSSHFCSSPICVSSRAQLLQGETSGHSDVRDSQFGKPIIDKPSLGTVAHKAGYHTIALGKWGCSSKDDTTTLQDERLIGMPLTRGFDEQAAAPISHESYYPVDDANNYEGSGFGTLPLPNGLTYQGAYFTDLYAAKAKQFMIQRASAEPDQPWLIYLAPKAPHHPMNVPSQAFPAGSGLSGGLTWPLNTLGGTQDTYIFPDYDATNWPVAEKRYATIIRRLDDTVGDLLQTIKDLGLASNTLVFLTADNGPSNEQHLWTFFQESGPYDGFKRDLYDGGLRQPTLAWWPGHITPGSRSDQNTAQSDILATVAELTGMAAPGRGDGLSFAPLLTGSGSVRNHPYFYWEFNGPQALIDPTLLSRKNYRDFSMRNQTQALRIGNQIGVRYNITAADDPLRLYDTRMDLHEDYDLGHVSALQPVLGEMQDRLRQGRRPLGDAPRPYDAALVAARPPAGAPVPGLRHASFAGVWPWVPDFREISPAVEGIAGNVDLSTQPAGDNFGLHFEGWIQVPADGTYTFSLAADQGALMWLHDSRLIDGDSLNGAESTATIQLAAGYHPIRIYYTHRRGNAMLNLSWSGPSFAKTVVPASSLFHDESTPRLDMVARDDWQTTEAGVPVWIDVLANDYHRSPFTAPGIALVTSPPGGQAVVSGGKILYTPRAGFLGQDTFQYTLTDGILTRTATVSVEVYAVNEEVRLPFDQSKGDSTSDASGGIRAIAQGFKKYDLRWDVGRFGKAFFLRGGASTMVLPDCRGISGTHSRTVSAWIKTPTAGTICAWGDNLTPGARWVMSLKQGGTLDSPDGRITMSPINGTLLRSTLNGIPSLGVRGINTTEGAAENATVRGNEQLRISFIAPTIVTEIQIASYGPTDGVVHLAGFSADPGATTSVPGITFSYASGTLSINPPASLVNLVPIHFSSLPPVPSLTLTDPLATDAGNGVGLSSLSYDGILLSVDSLKTGAGGALMVNVGGGQITATTNLRDDQWHHVACIFDESGSGDIGAAKLFVNGLEEVRSSVFHQAISTASTSALTIGAAFGTNHFSGGIDEFRLIPSALSSGEIASMAAATNNSAELWYYRYFGPGTPLWTVDDDNDGYDRYQEFALGLRPLLPDFSPLTLDQMSQGVATLTTYRRSPGDHGLQYILEESSDLGLSNPWTPVGFTELKVVPFLDGTEEVTLQTLVGGNNKMFFRWLAR